MLSLSIGPLALPLRPLLLLLSVALAVWLADRTARGGDGRAPGRVLLQATAVGLLVARILHVAGHAGPYLDAPLSVLDLRDGGWLAPAGFAAGLAWTGWQARRFAAARRAIGLGSAAGLSLWLAGATALWLSEPTRVPGLALADLDGGRVASLAERAGGRPLVLNLWATWCGPCRREMPVLAKAQAAHPDVAFVFANQGERAEVVRRWLQAEHPGLPGVALDEAARLGREVGSIGLPTTVFYDARGVRVGAHLGALNAAALEARLAGMTAR